MSTIKAVFFDLDDTLCDDAAAWVRCASRSAELASEAYPSMDVARLGRVFLHFSESYWNSPEPLTETRSIFDVRFAQWRQALEAMGVDGDAELATLLAADYGRRRSSEVELFHDALPTLTALRESGRQLVMITNGLQTTHVEKIERLGLQPYFDDIVIAGELGHFKPDAQIFHHALSLCGCWPSDAVMVGDDLVNDIAGAERMGIRSYWHNPHGRTLPDGAVEPSGGEIRLLSELLSRLTT